MLFNLDQKLSFYKINVLILLLCIVMIAVPFVLYIYQEYD